MPHRLHNGYGLLNFVFGQPDSATKVCARIIGFLEILLVDDTHSMRQQVTLLKNTTSALLFIRPESIRKIKPECVLNVSARDSLTRMRNKSTVRYGLSPSSSPSW